MSTIYVGYIVLALIVGFIVYTIVKSAKQASKNKDAAASATAPPTQGVGPTSGRPNVVEK